MASDERIAASGTPSTPTACCTGRARRRPDKQADLKKALFRIHFTEGRNLTDAGELTTAAQAAGLDRAEAAEVLTSDRYVQAVRAEQDLWRSRGISSVPAVVVEGKYLISGGQPPEVFEGRPAQDRGGDAGGFLALHRYRHPGSAGSLNVRHESVVAVAAPLGPGLRQDDIGFGRGTGPHGGPAGAFPTGRPGRMKPVVASAVGPDGKTPSDASDASDASASAAS
jgi:hypothetical protein